MAQYSHLLIISFSTSVPYLVLLSQNAQLLHIFHYTPLLERNNMGQYRCIIAATELVHFRRQQKMSDLPSCSKSSKMY